MISSTPNSFNVNVGGTSMPQSTIPKASFSLVANLKGLVRELNPMPKEARAMKYIIPATDTTSEMTTDTYHKYSTKEPLAGGGTKTYESPQDRQRDATAWYSTEGYSRILDSGTATDLPTKLPDLTMGDTGKNVETYQRWLLVHGFYQDPQWQTSGVFDAKTKAATERWQKMNNMPVSGKLDARTRQLLSDFVKHDFDEYVKDIGINPDFLRLTQSGKVPQDSDIPNGLGSVYDEKNKDRKVSLNPLQKGYVPLTDITNFENTTPQPKYTPPIDWSKLGTPAPSREGTPVPPAPSATSSLATAEQKANQEIQDRMLATFKPTTQTFLTRGLKNGTVRFEPNRYGGEFIFTPPTGSDTKLVGRDTSGRVANSTPSNLLNKSDVSIKKKK